MNRLLQTVAFAAVAVLIGVILYWQVEIIGRGGPIMIPIVMCSVFSVAIIMERIYYFFRLSMGHDIDGFFNELRGAVHGRRWREAEAAAGRLDGPLGKVVLAGLAARESSPDEIDETMEEAAHEELPYVERHLRWLSTLAQVATLMGLLGTVTGLVRAFQAIQQKTTGGNPVSPGDLAGGVWEALITTVAGLTVAIPTILAYNYLASRVAEVQFQMEKAAAIIAGWRRSGSSAT